mgnify:CR=1 FL=1
MAKFYGEIGYVTTVETRPGVWEEQVTERKYAGDILQNRRLVQSADQLNDNINIVNEISIVADPYANGNVYAMRYVVFMGAKWKITNVRVERPRLILTIGGVYNAPKT